MDIIQLYITRIALYLMFSIFFSPLTYLLLWITHLIQKNASLDFLNLIIAGCFLLILFTTGWLSWHMGALMTCENQKFSTAWSATFSDVRVRLSFIPIVGHFFGSLPDDEDDTDEV